MRQNLAAYLSRDDRVDPADSEQFSYTVQPRRGGIAGNAIRSWGCSALLVRFQSSYYSSLGRGLIGGVRRSRDEVGSRSSRPNTLGGS
jgi:hypothetical protein